MTSSFHEKDDDNSGEWEQGECEQEHDVRYAKRWKQQTLFLLADVIQIQCQSIH